MDAPPLARRLARGQLEVLIDSVLAHDERGAPRASSLVERGDDAEPAVREPAHRDAALGERLGELRGLAASITR